MHQEAYRFARQLQKFRENSAPNTWKNLLSNNKQIKQNILEFVKNVERYPGLQNILIKTLKLSVLQTKKNSLG